MLLSIKKKLTKMTFQHFLMEKFMNKQ